MKQRNLFLSITLAFSSLVIAQSVFAQPMPEICDDIDDARTEAIQKAQARHEQGSGGGGGGGGSAQEESYGDFYDDAYDVAKNNNSCMDQMGQMLSSNVSAYTGDGWGEIVDALSQIASSEACEAMKRGKQKLASNMPNIPNIPGGNNPNLPAVPGNIADVGNLIGGQGQSPSDQGNYDSYDLNNSGQSGAEILNNAFDNLAK